MWLQNEIKKCVAFLCIKDGEGKITPTATGFFVSIPSEKKLDTIYGYFITAKHNIAFAGKRDLWIRVNTKDGKTNEIQVPPNFQWVSHPDHESNPADLVIIPFPSHDFGILAIPVSMFLTPEIIRSGAIGVGNEVFITGLFTHLSGQQKNIPIVRMGNIAMLPDEKVPSKYFGDIDAYLIEARSIGGVSGSPVFFCKAQQTCNGFSSGSTIYLGGLIHGHWDTLEEKIDSFLPEEDAKESRGLNMGIAIVTPAIKILETLNCIDLKSKREEIDKKL